MAFTLLLSAALFAGLTVSHAEVLDLDSQKFSELWEASDLLLVEFYVPDSVNHKQITPELEEASKGLPGKGIDAKIARIDTLSEKRLADKFEIDTVDGHSVIKLFRNGMQKPISYKKPTVSNSILAFLERCSQPSTRTLRSVVEAIELTESDKTIVVGFFDTRDTQEYETYMKTSRSFQGTAMTDTVVFAEVVDPTLIKEFEIVYTPMVFLFKPQEDALGYTGKFTQEKLSEWIESVGIDLVRELRPDNFLELFNAGTPALLAFVDDDESQDNKDALVGNMNLVAGEHADSLTFIYTKRKQYDGLHEKLGFGADNPPICIMDFAKREHFLFGHTSKNVTNEAISNFVEAYLHGKLSKAEEKAVQVKVPQTIDDIPETVVIANPTKDVLMDFWVPWCDFYIHISVPHKGSPLVDIPHELPDFAKTQGKVDVVEEAAEGEM